MRIAAAAIILAALAALTACSPSARAGGSSGGNPLLGTWVLTEGNPSSCGSSITFAADTESTTNPDPSWNEHYKVSYNISPDKVYVMGNGAAVQYDLTGPDTIAWHGTSVCNYKRA
jgi:hypothetical protein